MFSRNERWVIDWAALGQKLGYGVIGGLITYASGTAVFNGNEDGWYGVGFGLILLTIAHYTTVWYKVSK